MKSIVYNVHPAVHELISWKKAQRIITTELQVYSKRIYFNIQFTYIRNLYIFREKNASTPNFFFHLFCSHYLSTNLKIDKLYDSQALLAKFAENVKTCQNGMHWLYLHTFGKQNNYLMWLREMMAILCVPFSPAQIYVNFYCILNNSLYLHKI